MQPVFLDHESTSPVKPEVLEAMMPYFNEKFAAPSGDRGYSMGIEAGEAVEQARKTIALSIGADEKEIIFTSGGTESNNLAIIGAARRYKKKGNHIAALAIDHSSVLDTLEALEEEGFSTSLIPVSSNGIVDPAEVKKAITDQTILVSVGHANGEIGVIQPISEIGKICREAGVKFHVDAVQSSGKIPVNVQEASIHIHPGLQIFHSSYVLPG